MNRSLPAMALSAVLALTVAGCSAATAPEASVATSCDVAGIGLTAIGAIIDDTTSSDDGDGDGDDRAFRTEIADQITTDADRLADQLRNREVAAAFSDLRASLVGYSDELSADSESAEGVAQARQDIETAGQRLTTLCGSQAAPTAPDGAAKANDSMGNDDARSDYSRGASDLDPHLQPGEMVSGSMYDSRARKTVRWSARLDRVETRVLNVLTWGSRWVITFHTDTSGEYYFTDETDESYWKWVSDTSDEHRIYFDSPAPAIARISRQHA